MLGQGIQRKNSNQIGGGRFKQDGTAAKAHLGIAGETIGRSSVIRTTDELNILTIQVIEINLPNSQGRGGFKQIAVRRKKNETVVLVQNRKKILKIIGWLFCDLHFAAFVQEPVVDI